MKIILFFLLLFPLTLFAQHDYLPQKDFLYKKTVDSIVREYRPAADKILVYQTGKKGTVYTILLINSFRGCEYWLLNLDSIERTGSISADTIFSFKKLSLAGAVKKEDQLKFTPPLSGVGLQTDIVLYKDDRRKFYFEYGDNITSYEPDEQLQTIRKEWIDIIKSELAMQGVLETN